MSRLVKTSQMSDALIVSLFLAFSGGFQDAYTYMVREHVFANAQTGNIVLMSTNLLEGKFGVALHYFIPLVCFFIGVIVADITREKHPEKGFGHWRQSIVLMEIAVLVVAGLLHNNVVANGLISFSCALQVQAFRKVNGKAYASTMCIGNMRAGASWLTQYFFHKNRFDLINALDYFLIIFIFAFGAAVGGVLSLKFQNQYVIWCTVPVLVIVHLLMRVDLEGKESK